MPFERTDKKLDELIKRALADEDNQLSRDAEHAGFEGTEIYDEVRKEAQQIWEAAHSEIHAYEELEARRDYAFLSLEREAGTPPLRTSAGVASFAPGWMLGVGALLTFGAVVFAVVQLARLGWRESFGSLLTRQGWLWIGSVILVIAAWYGLYTTIGVRRRRAGQRRADSDASLRKEWSRKLDEIAVKLGLYSLEKELKLKKEGVEKFLIEAKIKPALRTAINNRTKPSYSHVFSVRKPQGFGEVFDPRFAIDTEARKRLRFLLDNMPGGSIGIAGSRGAGKTTLLKLFCGPKRVIETLKGKPVLGVLVSAPVAYQTRDFILYLFSAVCQGVIEKEGGKFRGPVVPDDGGPDDPLDTPFFSLLRPAPALLVKFGLVLLLLSLVSALGLAALKSAGSRGQTASSQAAASQDAQQTQAQQQQAQQTAGGATPSPSPTVKEEESFASRFVGQLKIDPGSMLAWGVSLLAGGLVLGGLLGRNPWRLFLISLLGMFRRVLPLPKLRFRLEMQEEEARRKAESAGTVPADAPPPAAPNSLRARAELWLKAIKFQQSYTSGWSGALKLPVGLEGGVSRAVTLAENQLSLPEIVHFLTRFIEEVSQQYQVIIGIDELDKLVSDEQAQQFLNDIKSIFGLERCFYLISVSENAMSNFERRGLPFRDVFDSSFDSIVYVDHLNFASAQELLQQRVVGRPIPFFGLSYSMSGGLARDLIRNFRGVLESHQSNGAESDLEAICKQVVNSDLKAKVRATEISAKKIELEPESDEFLEKLYGLEGELDSEDRLLSSAKRLFNGTPPPPQFAATPAPAAAPPDKERAAKLEKLEGLAEELATYVYYSVTVRQFFRNGLGEPPLVAPPPGGSLDNLARARQALAVNPRITRALLKSFRSAHGLGTLP